MAAKQTEFTLREKGTGRVAAELEKTAATHTVPRANDGCKADRIYSAGSGTVWVAAVLE